MKQRRISLFLLVIYSMIFLPSILHVHEDGREMNVCQDCLSHVQHGGHFDQGSVMDTDCVLCNFLHTSYLTPTVLFLSAAVLITTLPVVLPTYDVVSRSINLPGLRAPPINCNLR